MSAATCTFAKRSDARGANAHGERGARDDLDHGPCAHVGADCVMTSVVGANAHDYEVALVSSTKFPIEGLLRPRLIPLGPDE